jgi:TetR/AcrR family transcriptional regulator, cholesterol catabolism regulator
MKATRAAALGEILRVAATCFGEMGYRATTLDTIAAKAGLSKVTLYRYVKSKDELLSLVFERTIESFRAGLGEIIAQRLPADEKIRRIVRYQVALLASHLPFLKVFFAEEAGLPGPMAARAARARREYDRAIERAYRDGVDEGLFRDLPPTLVVFGILGMCNWLHEWYRPDGRSSPTEIADVFVDILERGYLKPESAPRGDRVASALERIEARLVKLEAPKRRRVGARR